MLKEGNNAPDFTLPDQDGRPWRLADHRGQWLLLVFYPGDETPVCTRQLCDYRDGIDAFRDLGVEVIGISPDSPESHRRFREHRGLPFTLLSDESLKVAAQYGAKGLMGMKRAVFLIDPDGVCRYAHVEAVALFRRSREELLEVISALQAG
ncbi:MAG: peroxiredoxin [Wenzhouxiangellaceae bacterium]